MHFISKAKDWKNKNLFAWMKSIKPTWKSVKFKANINQKSKISKNFNKKRIQEKGKSMSKPFKIKILSSKNLKSKLLILPLFWVTGSLLMTRSKNLQALQSKIKILKIKKSTKSKKERKQQKSQMF